MNISELFALTNWITTEIEAPQIPQNYQNLYAILQQNAQPNTPKQPIESQKQVLIDSISAVALDRLTKDQLTLLRQFGISQAVGPEGVAAIENILYKNALDIATATQKTIDIYQKLTAGVAKSNQVKAGLQDCVVEESYELKNEVLMRVTFSGNAPMSNVTDFKKWGETWFDIGRGIAMAHDGAPEDIKIIGATKGSIVIELAVLASMAVTTSTIILSGLKVAERVLQIKKMAAEIRSLKLTNEAHADKLEEEAENEKTAGISAITAEIVEKLNLNHGAQGEKIKVLDTAVKNLVNFVEKGGEIDFFIPEDKSADGTKEQNAINAELRIAFEQIRQLEKKIDLLEQKNF